MPRLLKDTCPTAAEILAGQHDEHLANIMDACRHRLKNKFRKGMKVRLSGTKNPRVDGKVGTVLSVNTKTVVVGLGEATTDQWGTSWSDGEFNVPPHMLSAA